MSDGMGREFTYLSSHATNRYFIPNWGKSLMSKNIIKGINDMCPAHDIGKQCRTFNIEI